MSSFYFQHFLHEEEIEKELTQDNDKSKNLNKVFLNDNSKNIRDQFIREQQQLKLTNLPINKTSNLNFNKKNDRQFLKPNDLNNLVNNNLINKNNNQVNKNVKNNLANNQVNNLINKSNNQVNNNVKNNNLNNLSNNQVNHNIKNNLANNQVKNNNLNNDSEATKAYTKLSNNSSSLSKSNIRQNNNLTHVDLNNKSSISPIKRNYDSLSNEEIEIRLHPKKRLKSRWFSSQEENSLNANKFTPKQKETQLHPLVIDITKEISTNKKLEEPSKTPPLIDKKLNNISKVNNILQQMCSPAPSKRSPTSSNRSPLFVKSPNTLASTNKSVNNNIGNIDNIDDFDDFDNIDDIDDTDEIDNIDNNKIKNTDRNQNDNKENTSSNQKKVVNKSGNIFQYFKKPVVSEIKEDERMTNNSGYRILVYKYSDLFEEFQHFNEGPIFETDRSLVVRAPTGSGKTTIFEFAIIKLLNQLQSTDFKVLLIEPMKSICNEKISSWKKFERYGLSCYQLTGDSKFESEELIKNSIIICTPEKIELLTRNYKELELITQNLKLVLIDEIHVMGDTNRGQILEGFITRLKLAKSINNLNFRFISASATIGDLDTLCKFFDQEAMKIKFGEETRNCPLKKIVLGYDCADNINDFVFDKKLTQCLPSVLNKYHNGKQTLIFCPTRNITKDTAKFLSRGNYKKYVRDIQEMTEMINKISDNDLRDCLLTGVGFHHGGISVKDRKIIEDGFKDNLISILICTTSLVMGVNLPANLVIVKGTFRYIQSQFVQFTETEINQMIGRAGRQLKNNNSPTDTATAIIMTRNSKKSLYDGMFKDKPLESNFLESLCEFINTEIILEHVRNFDDAVNYIKMTYLYLRLYSNQEHYGISKQANIEQAIKNWTLRILRDLHKFKVIKFLDNQTIQKQEIGYIMSENSISFLTLRQFSEINDLAMGSLLIKLCECKELKQQTTLRNNEKSQLAEFNKNLRFQIKHKGSNRIIDVSSKINCLIQAELGLIFNSQNSNHLKFIQEANALIKIARSLAKGLVDYLAVKIDKRYSTFKNAVLLCKSLNAGLWNNTNKQITKQIPKIGQVLSMKLDDAGLTNFKKLREATPYEIESICGRKAPFGDEFFKFVNSVPEYKLKISQNSMNAGFLKVYLDIKIDLINYSNQPTGSSWLIVGDEEDSLLFYKKIDIQMFSIVDHSIEFTLHVNKVRTGLLYFNLINETIVGSDCFESYTPKYVDVVSKKDDLKEDEIINLDI